MSEARRSTETETTQQKGNGGARSFVQTLVALLVLLVTYAVGHVATLRAYGYMHLEAADAANARGDLLVTVATLKDQLETPTAIAAPAVRALFHDLEQSVLRAESTREVSGLFETAARELAELGIKDDISPKILEAAQGKAIEVVSAPEGERDVPKQVFGAQLETAQEWALDALGAQTLLDRVGQLKEGAGGLGYGVGSEVTRALVDIEQELGTDRPNRRLAAEMLSQVSDDIRGPQSLFWSHPAMRWLEVVAWSLAGMMVVRLWSIGKRIGNETFDSGWDWWWWAKIIQAPLLAIAVVLALSYFELGMASGETLGFKISLRDQPVELVVAVSFMLGLFSDKAYEFLRDLADRVLGRVGQPEEEDKKP